MNNVDQNPMLVALDQAKMPMSQDELNARSALADSSCNLRPMGNAAGLGMCGICITKREFPATDKNPTLTSKDWRVPTICTAHDWYGSGPCPDCADDAKTYAETHRIEKPTHPCRFCNSPAMIADELDCWWCEKCWVRREQVTETGPIPRPSFISRAISRLIAAPGYDHTDELRLLTKCALFVLLIILAFVLCNVVK